MSLRGLIRRRRSTPQAFRWGTVEERLAAEIERQDARFGEFTNNRASIRLGFACLEDEVAESLEAYEDDRRDDFCGLGFMATQEELVQVAALAHRLLAAFPGSTR
jgi:hypothetical protein